MNQDFANKVFQDILEKMKDEEYAAFQKEVVRRSDNIMDAAMLQVEKKYGVNIERLAAAVVLTGNKDGFIALTGTLMQLCFHIGYKAGLENAFEKEGTI